MMDKLCQVPYLMHPGYQNMVIVARKSYFWLGMKKEIDEYIYKCQKC